MIIGVRFLWLISAPILLAGSALAQAPTEPTEKILSADGHFLVPYVPQELLPQPPLPPTPTCGYTIIKQYPHDPNSFTQGLFFHDGALYESTGQYGRSRIARIDIADGKVLTLAKLPASQFGEGITRWKDQIIGVTWHNGIGHRWRMKDLKPLAGFSYAGEGWGLATNTDHIILSDGTATLRFLDPETMKVVRTLAVTENGRPINQLNELEYIEGEIWANIWFSDMIARIDPDSGKVTRFVDLSGLSRQAGVLDYDEVLNGIAWDEKEKRLFVTGKNWPKLFEIKITGCPI